jgi:aryl-alcohol dehydrogenase-like predicted oxidoreductase
VAHQAYYSLVGRDYEWELMPLAVDQNIGTVVWSPLGWGRLTGKTVPQIALNWLLQRPTISTIVIGARNEEQLKQNLGSIGWNLTPDQVSKLDKASDVPLPYPYWHQTQFEERNPQPVRWSSL